MGFSSRRHVKFFQLGKNLALASDADGFVLHLARRKIEQRRDGADVVARSQCRIFVHIDLGDFDAGVFDGKMLAPVLDEIAVEQPGFKIAKVNVDKNPALAARYDIRSIPTLLYFAAGEVKDKTVGVAGKRQILAKLEKLGVPA